MMVYNRTQADVDSAKQIWLEKIKAFLPLSESDIQTLERGFLTVNVLNRIENKQAEIKTLLNNDGYFGGGFINKSWAIGDYFGQEDLERLAENTSLLRTYIKVYSDTPTNPNPIYHFEEINKMEHILEDLELIIGELAENYKECGAFECGEE